MHTPAQCKRFSFLQHTQTYTNTSFYVNVCAILASPAYICTHRLNASAPAYTNLHKHQLLSKCMRDSCFSSMLKGTCSRKSLLVLIHSATLLCTPINTTIFQVGWPHQDGTTYNRADPRKHITVDSREFCSYRGGGRTHSSGKQPFRQH